MSRVSRFQDELFQLISQTHPPPYKYVQIKELYNRGSFDRYYNLLKFCQKIESLRFICMEDQYSFFLKYSNR